jgi:hypothetical protein
MVNHYIIILAAIVSMLIGAFWYSPRVFGRVWMKLMGKERARFPKRSYIIGFMKEIVTAYVLAIMIFSVGLGMITGFLVWIGFIATSSLSIVLWEKKPIKLYILNNIYSLISLLVMSWMISAWA